MLLLAACDMPSQWEKPGVERAESRIAADCLRDKGYEPVRLLAAKAG